LIGLHWVPAITVPMHLGLIDGPFVPHNVISAEGGPVPLPTKVPDGPQTYNLNIPWVQEWNPDMLSFYVKTSRQANPKRGPYRERYPLTGHFYIFFVPKALRNKRPSMFPKSRASMETDAHSSTEYSMQ
jgi:hypothetical protein